MSKEIQVTYMLSETDVFNTEEVVILLGHENNNYSVLKKTLNNLIKHTTKGGETIK